MKEKLRAFSQHYFTFRKKMEDMFLGHILKDLEKEKRKYYRKYHIEPREEDVREIKKELVMKRTLLYFSMVVLVVLFLFVKGD